MRCHICDVVLAEPTWNSEHEDWDPCETCKAVIQDTLDGFNDRPAAAEDELGDDLQLDKMIYQGWVSED